MSKSSTAKVSAKSTTNARSKVLGGKVTPRATALTGEEGEYLRKLKAKSERGTALTPQQKTDLKTLEERRLARNEYTKQLRSAAKEAAVAKPAVAMVVPNKDGSASYFDASRQPIGERPATVATVQSAMTLSKADVVGALRVQLVIAERERAAGLVSSDRVDALRTALQLAQLLAD